MHVWIGGHVKVTGQAQISGYVTVLRGDVMVDGYTVISGCDTPRAECKEEHEDMER